MASNDPPFGHTAPWDATATASPEEQELPHVLGEPQEPDTETQARLAYQEILDKEKPGKYYTPLMGFYGSIGMGVMFFDKVCGSAILLQAQDTARAVDKLARKNDAVRRVVEAVLSSSAITELAVAHAPIIATIFKHHVPQSYQERFGEFLAQGLAAAPISPNGSPAD